MNYVSKHAQIVIKLDYDHGYDAVLAVDVSSTVAPIVNGHTLIDIRRIAKLLVEPERRLQV